jgi:hypothetical protein
VLFLFEEIEEALANLYGSHGRGAFYLFRLAERAAKIAEGWP